MEELDLKELFEVFWNKKLIIILSVFTFICIGTVYSFSFVKPKYKTYTTLLLAKINEKETIDSSITTTEVTLNQKLVSTYSELIKSKTVLRTVLNNLNLKMSEEKLRSNVSVTTRKDTEVIEISVVGDSPEIIVKIANEIANVFSKQVSEYYNINNVNIVDKAELPNEPYNINHIKDVAIFAFIGLALSFAYILIANMLDTTVKDTESIEKQLGLPVLVCIPEYETIKKGGIH